MPAFDRNTQIVGMLTDHHDKQSSNLPVPSIMDDHRAHIIFGQSVAGDAGKLCRFDDDGTIWARLDTVRKAMRNAASWVAEELAGFGGVIPGRDLLRRLDHGEATAPEQLEAAMALRLMNKPDVGFKGLRITIQVTEGGQVSTHTQGFDTTGNLTQGMLDAAHKALSQEIEDFRRCPFHSPRQALEPKP